MEDFVDDHAVGHEAEHDAHPDACPPDHWLAEAHAGIDRNPIQEVVRLRAFTVLLQVDLQFGWFCRSRRFGGLLDRVCPSSAYSRCPSQ